MLCFLKVQGYQPTSHLCTVYLSICSRVDGSVFSLRGVGITCTFQLAVFRKVLFHDIPVFCYRNRNRILFTMCFNMHILLYMHTFKLFIVGHNSEGEDPCFKIVFVPLLLIPNFNLYFFFFYSARTH